MTSFKAVSASNCLLNCVLSIGFAGCSVLTFCERTHTTCTYMYKRSSLNENSSLIDAYLLCILEEFKDINTSFLSQPSFDTEISSWTLSMYKSVQ